MLDSIKTLSDFVHREMLKSIHRKKSMLNQYTYSDTEPGPNALVQCKAAAYPPSLELILRARKMLRVLTIRTATSGDVGGHESDCYNQIKFASRLS
jgi:hypothetical protein